MACPLGEMHCGDMTLPTIVHPAGAVAGLVSGCGNGEALKLPASSALVGRVRFCARTANRPSKVVIAKRGFEYVVCCSRGCIQLGSGVCGIKDVVTQILKDAAVE